MNHAIVFLRKVYRQPGVMLLAPLLFPAMLLAQDQKGEAIPAVRDHLREQFTPADYGNMLKKEQNGEIPRGGGVVFSPAGADILVNNNTGGGTTSGFTQSETSILAFGNSVVIGFNDAGSYAGGATNKFTGYSYSTDGGATFTDGGTLPTFPTGDAGDPVLARDNVSGRLYFSTLQFSGDGIAVFHSDNNGITWSPPSQGAPGISGFGDKQWIAVDNAAGSGQGNIYLMVRDFGTRNGIYFYRSVDQGATFGPNGGTLITAGFQGAFVTVGADHAVYAFWWAGTTIQVRKSVDQGITFGPAVTVASGLTAPGTNGDLGLTGIRQGTASAAGFRSNSFPHAAVNPVSGHIYVTYNDNPPGADKADVYMVMSVDGGATWSARVRVNDDVTQTDQWQPTIAVTPDGNYLGVFYYSRQEDPVNNNLFKYYGRTARISGSTVTFAPGFAISDVASLPEFGRDAIVNSTYMGDYNVAATTAGRFHVVWSDNRDDLAGGAPRKDPNVYYESFPPSSALPGPNISVNPLNIDFGSVVVGQTGGPVTVVLQNIGDAPLTVNAISSPAPDFSVTPPSLPAIIPSLGSVTFTASFAPLSGGAQTSSFNVTSNAANDASVTVNLQGSGIVPPPNDLCENAIPLSCGSSIDGTTVLATFDNAATCGTTNTAPGVWYTVAGTGAPITLSTCTAASYDTKLSVFSGTCGALVCVGGNDDFSGCGLRSQLTFNSVRGTTYYVLVHGFSNATGTFTLSSSTCPAEIAVTPDSIRILAPLNGTGSGQMSITNTAASGASDLNWSVTSSSGARPFAGPGIAGDGGQQEPLFRLTTETLNTLRGGSLAPDALAKLSALVNAPAVAKESFYGTLASLIGEQQVKANHQNLFERSMTWTTVPEEKGKAAEEVDGTPAPGGATGILAAGGPDAFGYEFIDSDEPGGPVFNWIDITTTGTSVSLGDDAAVLVPLPFTFPFYGVGKTGVRIGSNGYLTFGTSGTAFTNAGIPSTGAPNDIICPFWDDLNPTAGGTVHYRSTATQFVVQYTNIPRFGTTQPNTFEVVLNSDGSMLFQYLDMQGLLTSATVGIENATGTVGLQVVFNAPYIHNNLAVRLAVPPPCPWIASVTPSSGIIPAGGSQQATINANAAGLPIGTYRCEVRVNSNAANASRVVVPVRLIVGSPVERIDDLIGKVRTLLTARVLNNGQANSLISKLQAARKNVIEGRITPALNQLVAFINDVNALVLGRVLTAAQGQALIDAANGIINLINTMLGPIGGGDAGTLANAVPVEFLLDQNYPNPFNPATTIEYGVPTNARVTLDVYDVLGRRVAELVRGNLAAGYYNVEFNAASLASGIYFYRMAANGDDGRTFTQIRKLMVVK